MCLRFLFISWLLFCGKPTKCVLWDFGILAQLSVVVQVLKVCAICQFEAPSPVDKFSRKHLAQSQFVPVSTLWVHTAGWLGCLIVCIRVAKQDGMHCGKHTNRCTEVRDPCGCIWGYLELPQSFNSRPTPPPRPTPGATCWTTSAPTPSRPWCSCTPRGPWRRRSTPRWTGTPSW